MMVDFASDVNPYDLQKVVASDMGEHDRNCFVLDVGRNEYGREVASLQRLADLIDHSQHHLEELTPIRKFYILGAWHLTPSKAKCEGWIDAHACQEGEPHMFTSEEKEWHDGGKLIAKLAAMMPKLEELTWMSSLPFTAYVWESLSTSMRKIILDIGHPVRLQVHSFTDVTKSYITHKELTPMLQQTRLEELRLFHMQDSYQSLIWETVYRNTNEEGMRLLDLTMSKAPLVRSEHWHKANDVAGLNVAIDSGEKEYKGIDGKGVLHHSYGTGEYLDSFCMRRARIAAKLEESGPLPLQYLKLDGFVIDHVPFEEELAALELLTCGENCIDAGLRAPHNR
ncbi:hypothetical protein NX059_005695 [Plenodomus lindquistii]|nr:hypothetical protein NX059_005695 [Plenodomus lindquistii]